MNLIELDILVMKLCTLITTTPDRSGYLDILSDVRELGYETISKIAYLNPNEGVFCSYDDKGVMEILKVVRNGSIDAYIKGELIVEFQGENVDKGNNVVGNVKEGSNLAGVDKDMVHEVGVDGGQDNLVASVCGGV
ncbi:conserved hypothetical protein [Ricinus communis]|uniref:Uncharacterized protein n=1 Tax=Ricinus communis TaxID=3988 RepID=B9REJ1_RICCO|nr:conserved hypothetical protein [Ricinus communis]